MNQMAISAMPPSTVCACKHKQGQVEAGNGGNVS